MERAFRQGVHSRRQRTFRLENGELHDMPRPGGVNTQRDELRQLLVDDIRNESCRQGLNRGLKIECALNQSERILFFGFKFLQPVRSEFPRGVVYVFPVVRAVHYFDTIL